jgi:hypothetical protein
MLAITVADPDLWGHVKFGQDTWEAGTPVRSDPYSYLTGDRPWINHEWLSGLAFYCVYAVAGSRGLAVAKLLLALLLCGAVYRQLRGDGLEPRRAGIVLLLVTLGLAPGLVTLRPQIFTFFLLYALLRLLRRAEAGAPSVLWAVPLLAAVWANLHGAVLAGLAVLLLWTGIHTVLWVSSGRGDRPDFDVVPPSATVAPAAAAVAATLLNPWGTALLGLLLHPETLSRAEITEWQPLRLPSIEGAIYAALAGVAVLAMAYTQRPRSPSLGAVLLALGLAPLVATRHLNLFALAVPVIAGPHLADTWNRLPAGPGGGPPGPRLSGRAALACGLVAVLLLLPAVGRLRCVQLDPRLGGDYPAAAVARIKASGARGNLAVEFDWGEYAIWHLGPAVKVSVDGRRDSVYSPASYWENWRFKTGSGEWDALLTRRPSDFVLVRRSSAPDNLLRLHPDWTLAHEDRVSAVFARRGSAHAKALRKAPVGGLPADGAGLCFP